jgi:hypothetical protein
MQDGGGSELDVELLPVACRLLGRNPVTLPPSPFGANLTIRKINRLICLDLCFQRKRNVIKWIVIKWNGRFLSPVGSMQISFTLPEVIPK